jgi:CO dehydrogenase/acetyl-CoA synthase gamma subunit (corrinoid Fe-S protein)
MVVEQEMAEIYPPTAEDISEFLPETDCKSCGFSNCIEFAEAVIHRAIEPRKCPDLGERFADVMAAIVALNQEPIPYNVMMEQESCDLIEICGPGRNAPLLITCNFQETVRILKEILEHTRTPANLLPTDTHGYSVDNAVHERMFKAIEIWKAMQENHVEAKVDRRILIIPGLAEPEKNTIRLLTKWEVLVGPVSGFLLPLFMMQNEDRWET